MLPGAGSIMLQHEQAFHSEQEPDGTSDLEYWWVLDLFELTIFCGTLPCRDAEQTEPLANHVCAFHPRPGRTTSSLEGSGNSWRHGVLRVLPCFYDCCWRLRHFTLPVDFRMLDESATEIRMQTRRSGLCSPLALEGFLQLLESTETHEILPATWHVRCLEMITISFCWTRHMSIYLLQALNIIKQSFNIDITQYMSINYKH